MAAYRFRTTTHDRMRLVLRHRKVSAALRAYAALTTSAARGAVREMDQLRR